MSRHGHQQTAVYGNINIDQYLLNIDRSLLEKVIHRSLLNIDQYLLNINWPLLNIDQHLLNIDRYLLNIDRSLLNIDRHLLNIDLAKDAFFINITKNGTERDEMFLR